MDVEDIDWNQNRAGVFCFSPTGGINEKKESLKSYSFRLILAFWRIKWKYVYEIVVEMDGYQFEVNKISKKIRKVEEITEHKNIDLIRFK